MAHSSGQRRGNRQGWGWRDRSDNQIAIEPNKSYVLDFGEVAGYQMPAAVTVEAGSSGQGYDVTVTCQPSTGSMEAWAQTYGVDLDAPEYADRNGEPFKRLLKRFAFGSTPAEPESEARRKEPAAGTRFEEGGQEYMCFTYRRRKEGTSHVDETKTE